jgi:hypothetical protein
VGNDSRLEEDLEAQGGNFLILIVITYHRMYSLEVIKICIFDIFDEEENERKGN